MPDGWIQGFLGNLLVTKVDKRQQRITLKLQGIGFAERCVQVIQEKILGPAREEKEKIESQLMQ